MTYVCGVRWSVGAVRVVFLARYFEDSFRVYERGLALFSFPHVLEVWKTYLSKASSTRLLVHSLCTPCALPVRRRRVSRSIRVNLVIWQRGLQLGGATKDQSFRKLV